MVAVQTEVRKMTYEEFRYLEIPDGDTSIYELINGIIMRRSSPHSEHQVTQAHVLGLIYNFLLTNKLGRVLGAPLDVVFSDEDSAQPDVLFIKKEREKIIERGGPVWGSPDLIAKHDRETKKGLYERFGVTEYWIVDPLALTVEVFVLENGKYTNFCFAEVNVKNTVKSQVLTDFELDITTIFE
jgi:Uma2 family endonuclease